MAEIDPPWWSGHPSNKKAAAKTTPKTGRLKKDSKGTFGEQLWSALGGGGIDKSNINNYEKGTLKFTPDNRSSTDPRSTIRKVWDELKGDTVGANPIRYVDRGSADVPKGPKGPRGGKTTSVVATPKRVATKTTKVTPAKRSPMQSQRMEAAGYTTSAPSSAHPGFTFGSKSSARPKVAAAKKTKIGASHNVARKSLFKTRKD